MYQVAHTQAWTFLSNCEYVVAPFIERLVFKYALTLALVVSEYGSILMFIGVKLWISNFTGEAVGKVVALLLIFIVVAGDEVVITGEVVIAWSLVCVVSCLPYFLTV